MRKFASNALAARGFAVALAGLIGACASAQAESAPAATATASSSDGKDCFNGTTVSGWNKIDEKTVRVSAGPSKSYDLTLMSAPVGRLDQEAIALKSPPSDWICTGNGLGVSVIAGGTTGISPQSYPVTKVTRAPTPAQEREAKEAAEAAGAPAQPH